MNAALTQPRRSIAPWLTAVLAVVTVLVALELAVWRSGWFHRRFPATDPQVAPRHGQRLALVRSLRPKVVFLGNSRVLQGIRPVLFDQGTGARQQTANLGISGAPVYIWHLFIRRLATLPADVRPRAVLVGLTATDLLTPDIRPEPPDLHGLLDWPADAMPGDVGWANSLDWGLGRVWHLWQNRTICRKILEDKLKAMTQPREGTAAGMSAARPDPIWQEEAARGFQVDFGHAGLTAVPLRPWPAGSPLPQLPWLQRLTETCRRHGMAVQVVVLPQYGRMRPDAAHQAMMTALRHLSVDGVQDLSGMPFRAVEWRDGEHLTPAGATRLTSRLAGSLREWVGHAVP